jgi:hypothetical protein
MRRVLHAFVAAFAVVGFAAPAKATNWVFCYVKGGKPDGGLTPALILTPISELPGDSVDMSRIRMAFFDALDERRATQEFPYVSYDVDCEGSYVRSSIDRKYAEFTSESPNAKRLNWSPPSGSLAPPAPREQIVIGGGNSSSDSGSEGQNEQPSAADVRAQKEREYQEKVAAYEAALAEQRRQVEAYEQAKRDIATRHQQSMADAQQALADYEQKMEEHRKQVADAERAQEAYRQALEQARAQEKRDEVVAFKEGVVLCERMSAESREWRCYGPLQTTIAALDSDSAKVPLGQACGSDRSIRELGVVSGYRAYGCGFGIHPTAHDYPGNIDVPARLGIGYVPGRVEFHCPKSKLAYCRSL